MKFMKKAVLSLFMFLLVFGCTLQGGSQGTAVKVDVKKLENNMKESFAKAGQELKVEVKEIKDISDIIPGFAYVEISIYKDEKLLNSDKVITNGTYFTKEVIDSTSLSSLTDALEFDVIEAVDINTDNLTLVAGSKDAKNVIVEITDFQCPYCKRGNTFLKNALSNKSDYALYIIHLPLTGMHPSAEVMARIFEAGMVMGHNFNNDLFEADYLQTLQDKAMEKQKEGVELNQEIVDVIVKEFNDTIIEEYAAKTDDPEKFKSLVNSEEIKKKVEDAKNLAVSLDAISTPIFYINGKMISGFNEGLLNKAINKF